jgi:hypothetical protein
MLELFDLGPKDRLIAQLLMSQGLLPHDEFKKAVAASQQSFFFSLAEILVGKGVVTLDKLEGLLHDYCRKLRLGELALAQGLISEAQLELALSLQESRDLRIGEIFKELHLLTEAQIETLLDYQQRCRVEAAAC